MSTTSPGLSLEHPFPVVNTTVPRQLPLFLTDMIHHNISRYKKKRIILGKGSMSPPPYGVSRGRQILSPELFLKKFNLVRKCLQEVVGLTTGQRETTLRLLRYWAYYQKVYTKESTITAEPGCSKATYWRTIRILEHRGLITVINRFFIRPHAQTSNLYRFDKLLIILARYLAERGVRFYSDHLQPYLLMPGASFWPWATQTPAARAGPT